jgi:cyclopropane fatty-acyl-phospholipid synthase-like methyltransferase
MEITLDPNRLIAMPDLEVEDGNAFRNPPPDIQKRSNYAEVTKSYEIAASFLRFVYGHLDSRPERVLDFGCGWGRMLRLLKFADLAGELHGCDIDLIPLEWARRAIPDVMLTRSQTFPPCMYRDAAFDLVYAYSVFSHLSPEACKAWLAELRRIVKPDGYVCVTTQGLKGLEWVAGNPMFGELGLPNAAERYQAGEFLYAVWSPDLPHYGHAAIPRVYFEQLKDFSVEAWDSSLPQDCVVLRPR